jgi:hypothetical protein
MRLDISKINFSKLDIKRGLKLPQEMSEALAEDIGISIITLRDVSRYLRFVLGQRMLKAREGEFVKNIY